MSTRTTSRSAAKRNQASSPPRGSASPVRRRTRSQSVELGTDDATTTSRRAGKRNARQASVESDNSDASYASGAKGRRTKATRAATLNQDLSVVAEDEDEEDEDEESEDGETIRLSPHYERRSQSPGAMSQMSGTTAITSHSVAEMQDLDSKSIVEVLPDLFTSARKILKQLAPSGVSYELVESIVRELKILGSPLAGRLKRAEDKFKLDREAYGNDTYIQVPLILRKLFNSLDPPTGTFRPDAILQAANLATLARDLAIAQKEGRTTYQDIGEIDHNFPDVFVSKFDGNVNLGGSNLSNESFSIGLEIRTQYTILAMIHFRDNPLGSSQTFDPDRILGDCFIDSPANPDPDLKYLYDCLENGRVKNIMRVAPNSQEQVAEIKQRVKEIAESFRDTPEAGDDIVDFDYLEQQFPWQRFVTHFIQWIRMRLDEINESVVDRGSPKTIVRDLMSTLNIGDSQLDLESSPSPISRRAGESTPPPSVQGNRSGTNFYNNDMNNILQLEKLKREMKPNQAPPSNQNQRGSSKTAASNSNAKSSNRPIPGFRGVPQEEFEEMISGMDDDDEVNADDPQSTADAFTAWKSHSSYKNKENQPALGGEGMVPRRRYDEPQPDARRVEWEDYDSQGIPGPSSKRKRPESEDDDEESQDEGFEVDRRPQNTEKKIYNKSTVRQNAPTPVRPASPKRRRVPNPEDKAAEKERSNRERAASLLQQSARNPSEEEEEDEDNGHQDDDEDDEDDEDDDDDSAPDFTQINIAANVASQRVKARTAKVQTRTPWSQNDTNQLIRLIETNGCSWSFIYKLAEFERGEVGQVALKDRARNIKVSYLKSGFELPVNFDKVALGTKEIESVRSVIPNYNG